MIEDTEHLDGRPDGHDAPETPAPPAPAPEVEPEEAAAAVPAWREVLERIDRHDAAVTGALADLRAQLAREHERAAAREHVIDRLHDDNARLRAGERQLLLRPVLTDLQRLRHEMLQESGRLPAHFDAAQAAQLLRSYAHHLELTLERGGVLVVSPASGTPVDAAAHRVTGTVPTGDPSQDTTIAEVVLDGYHDAVIDRTVLAAAVRVHRWEPDHAQTL